MNDTYLNATLLSGNNELSAYSPDLEPNTISYSTAIVGNDLFMLQLHDKGDNNFYWKLTRKDTSDNMRLISESNPLTPDFYIESPDNSLGSLSYKLTPKCSELIYLEDKSALLFAVEVIDIRPDGINEGSYTQKLKSIYVFKYTIDTDSYIYNELTNDENIRLTGHSGGKILQRVSNDTLTIGGIKRTNLSIQHLFWVVSTDCEFSPPYTLDIRADKAILSASSKTNTAVMLTREYKDYTTVVSYRYYVPDNPNNPTVVPLEGSSSEYIPSNPFSVSDFPFYDKQPESRMILKVTRDDPSYPATGSVITIGADGAVKEEDERVNISLSGDSFWTTNYLNGFSYNGGWIFWSSKHIVQLTRAGDKEMNATIIDMPFPQYKSENMAYGIKGVFPVEGRLKVLVGTYEVFLQ